MQSDKKPPQDVPEIGSFLQGLEETGPEVDTGRDTSPERPVEPKEDPEKD
jgi:hypothetical protein